MRHPRLLLVALATTLAACGSQPAGVPPDAPPDAPPDPGVPVSVSLTTEQQAEIERLQGLVAASAGLDAAGLLALRAVPFRSTLGYDPAATVNLDLVQGSALALDATELAALRADGFVVTDRHRYPHFAYGYQTIYAQDLPVFVSADAILQAVHQSYDEILATLERTALAPELDALLASMRSRLRTAPTADATARADADLFLAVALSLLRDGAVEPVAGASGAEVVRLVALAKAASGAEDLTLFGTSRILDFSQFRPRGHYATFRRWRRTSAP